MGVWLLRLVAIAAALETMRLASLPVPRDPVRDAAAWIDRAAALELAGDTTGAGRALARAAAVDRTSRPLFALAAYHFRRREQEKFQRAASRLVSLPGADLRGVFAMALADERTAALVEGWLPPRVEPRRDWLIAAMAAGNRPLSRRAAVALAAVARPEDDWRAALDACDRAIEAGDADGALEIWRVLAARSLVPGVPGPVTNGSFAWTPLGHGFDWRVHEPAGVERSIGPGHLRFELNGKQGERIELAGQWMPLIAGTRYRVRWRAEGMLDGVTITLPDGATVAAAAGRAAFVAASAIGQITIGYQRRPGTARGTGDLTFRSFDVERDAP